MLKFNIITLKHIADNLLLLFYQDMKHYYIKHAEYIISEGKYRASESDHQKAVDTPLKKGNEKRLKNIEKTVDKVGTNLCHFR